MISRSVIVCSTLIDAIVREGFRRFGARLAGAGGTNDPMADLLAQGLACREFALANRQFGWAAPGSQRDVKRDLTVAGTSTTLEEGQATFGHLVDAVTKLLEAGHIRREEPVVVAGQLWSALHGYVLLAAFTRRP